MAKGIGLADELVCAIQSPWAGRRLILVAKFLYLAARFSALEEALR